MRAYSVDLRERVVGAVVVEGWSQAQAARVYGVSEPSVSRFDLAPVLRTSGCATNRKHNRYGNHTKQVWQEI